MPLNAQCQIEGNARARNGNRIKRNRADAALTVPHMGDVLGVGAFWDCTVSLSDSYPIKQKASAFSLADAS